MKDYTLIFVISIIGIFIAYGVLLLSYFLGPKRNFPEKLEPYESGVKPGRWGGSLNIHYYLIGLSFLVFDIEAIFLFPWALNIEKFKIFAFFEAFIFIFILIIGYFYILSKGGFQAK